MSRVSIGKKLIPDRFPLHGDRTRLPGSLFVARSLAVRRLGEHARTSAQRFLADPEHEGVTFYLVQVWVATLRISERVAKKIVDVHGITPQQVRDAVVRVEGLEGSWDYHPVRGLRAIIRVVIGEDNVLVVLYPADDLGFNVWRLGSAYRVQ